jgi:hypothetical protein
LNSSPPTPQHFEEITEAGDSRSLGEKLIGVQPADKFGRFGQQPSPTSAEEIWSVEYCRQNPEKAAEVIRTLQFMLGAIEMELHGIMEIVGK